MMKTSDTGIAIPHAWTARRASCSQVPNLPQTQCAQLSTERSRRTSAPRPTLTLNLKEHSNQQEETEQTETEAFCQTNHPVWVA